MHDVLEERIRENRWAPEKSGTPAKLITATGKLNKRIHHGSTQNREPENQNTEPEQIKHRTRTQKQRTRTENQNTEPERRTRTQKNREPQ